MCKKYPATCVQFHEICVWRKSINYKNSFFVIHYSHKISWNENLVIYWFEFYPDMILINLPFFSKSNEAETILRSGIPSEFKLLPGDCAVPPISPDYPLFLSPYNAKVREILYTNNNGTVGWNLKKYIILCLYANYLLQWVFFTLCGLHFCR